MLKKRFENEVLRLLPNFAVSSPYFYEVPVDHFLTGFCWEMPRGGIYIWRYAFPIFDLTSSVHLSYGDRLPQPDDFISTWNAPAEIKSSDIEHNLAHEFVKRITPYRQSVSRVGSVDAFIEYMRARNMRNSIVRRGYALSLIMAGDAETGLKELELCLQAPQNHEFAVKIYQMIDAVRSGTARQILLAREIEFKTRHGIQ